MVLWSDQSNKNIYSTNSSVRHMIQVSGSDCLQLYRINHTFLLFPAPPGMVLVRTETGQLVMVPQQVLAQAQAKTQQGQTVVTQRPATPTAGATIRVSSAPTVGLVLRTRVSGFRF